MLLTMRVGLTSQLKSQPQFEDIGTVLASDNLTDEISLDDESSSQALKPHIYYKSKTVKVKIISKYIFLNLLYVNNYFACS